MRIQPVATEMARTIGAALVGLALFCVPASAQSAVPLLVDADWLSQHVNDGDLVLLHVGAKGGYDSGHIAGARYISEDDVTKPHDHSNISDLMLELPTPEILRAKLASLGVSDGSRIVVYVGNDGSVQSATRIVFTLDYLGLGDRTSLLN